MEPTFSILISVCSADPKKVRKLIESIQRQTYRKWEICFSCGNEFLKSKDVLLSKRVRSDQRIKVIFSKSSLSVTENMNRALKISNGDFITFVEAEGLLEKDAFYECVKIINQYPQIDMLYTDEDRISVDGKRYFHPHFKSDFNLDLLRSTNYIGHLFVVKKELQKEIGTFCEKLYYEYEYDFILRCIEKSEHIWHIPKVLYHKRVNKNSNIGIQSKEKEKVIKEHLTRCELKGFVHVHDSGICKVNYQLEIEPLVSILIPNKDHVDDLERCIRSLFEISEYSNFEVVIVENGSTEKETFQYYMSLLERYKNVQIVTWNKSKEFNYSAINNYGVNSTKGEYILFLNNDTEVINRNCIYEMISHVVRSEVGAVGARLYYPDGTIQHAGVILGLGGIAGHAFCGKGHNAKGYFGRIQCTQNLTAVTAACMMMPRTLFKELGGFDEKLKVAFNDVDLCMRIRKAGKLIVYTPYAELYHYESKSRGIEDTDEKLERFHGEVHYFEKKWKQELEAGDPYYNPNLTLTKNDFSLRIV
ncbi:glycosyltransferase family 2 protein [Sporofaciens musculi]|uniref:glycosyltransferase family 2 protein n=1 Tax=Sporofaciens musculi TaxID=2681861 RepID=UPI002AC331B7|nr:glycosyltransferase family 2 protein [Sporofaciens musculi]